MAAKITQISIIDNVHVQSMVKIPYSRTTY